MKKKVRERKREKNYFSLLCLSASNPSFSFFSISFSVFEISFALFFNSVLRSSILKKKGCNKKNNNDKNDDKDDDNDVN